MRRCSSGVSLGIRRSGSSAGSPTGSEPSGSRWAARWPCMRCALTSAIAAATPPRSSSSGVALGGAAGRRRRDRGRPFPFPRAGAARRAERAREAGRSTAPLSKSARHSDGTDSGFSRYCSRIRSRSRSSARRRPSAPSLFCSRASRPCPRRARSEERRLVTTAIDHRRAASRRPAIHDGGGRELLVAPADPGGDQREEHGGDLDPHRPELEVVPLMLRLKFVIPITAMKIAAAAIRPATVSARCGGHRRRARSPRHLRPGDAAPRPTRRRAVRAAARAARPEPREPPAGASGRPASSAVRSAGSSGFGSARIAHQTTQQR